MFPKLNLIQHDSKICVQKNYCALGKEGATTNFTWVWNLRSVFCGGDCSFFLFFIGCGSLVTRRLCGILRIFLQFRLKLLCRLQFKASMIVLLQYSINIQRMNAYITTLNRLLFLIQHNTNQDMMQLKNIDVFLVYLEQ